MNKHESPALLFVINPGSGSNDVDWPVEIDQFFEALPNKTEKYFLTPETSIDSLKDKINTWAPQRVVAVGGDGTVKLVAECLLHTSIEMGILPAGSANGLAKELGIAMDAKGALQSLLNPRTQAIHLVKINNQLCIHLSDIGFNASVIKIFESAKQRGMAGYVKAAWKVLWRHAVMDVTICIDNTYVQRKAAMVVVANATRYGSGAVINPAGRLTDNLFEVVVIKKISFNEIFKMMFSHQPYNKEKTEVFQAQSIRVLSSRKVHFQVDGEYQGKINNIDAHILQNAIRIIQY